jgi:UDP-N-acetylmuramoyl-tripeptide--D-alanyl-D-alanine ligase
MTPIQELLDIHARCSGVIIDSRKVVSGSMFFALKGEQTDGNRFAHQAVEMGAIAAIVDDIALKDVPGCYYVPDVLTALQQLALEYRKKWSIPVFALTGSNGKTTTKELIQAVLSKKYTTSATVGNLNNHIGVPLTLLAVPRDAEIAIIEMGANHQGEIDMLSRLALPTHGLITNIGKAHLEGFGGLDGVKKGKSELYRFLMPSKGVIFMNSANAVLEDVIAGYDPLITYGTKGNETVHGSFQSEGSFAAVKVDGQMFTSQLVGDYNGHNILAAICVGRYFGVDNTSIAEAIAAYTPQNNRSQWLEHKGNFYIMDAYNANPSSMRAAIEHFAAMQVRPKVLIIGDMLELGEEGDLEHRQIIDMALDSELDQVISVGPLFGAADEFGRTKHFENTINLNEYLLNKSYKNTYFLVKGSRRIGLERIIQ